MDAPCAAKRPAIASPMPEAPPVITAVFCVREKGSVLIGRVFLIFGLVIVARHAPAHGPVGAGEVEAGAGVELADLAAIKLLPGHGVCRGRGEAGTVSLFPL